MTDAGASHLAVSVDRLRAEAIAVLAAPRAPAVAPSRGLAGAALTVRETLERLRAAVIAAGDGMPPRRALLALLERAEHLEGRVLRAIREDDATRRDRLDRGLVELRACESSSAVLDRLCSIALRALDADRVVVGMVRDRAWSASRSATTGSTGPGEVRVGAAPADLGGLPVEGAVVTSGRATAADESTTGRPAVVAPIPVAGRVVALLHVSPASGCPIPRTLATAERFGRVVGEVFEALDATERLAEIDRAVDRTVGRLREHVEATPGGTTPLGPIAGRRGAGTDPDAAAPMRASARLTPRQRETLALMLRGRSNAEIADALLISVPTVKGHISAVLRAVGAVNRADAITRYLDGDPSA